MDKVRVGLVGIGSRGTVLLKILLDLEGVEVKAVCDIVEDRVVKGQNLVTAAGKPKPTGYSRGETDFQRLCETEDLDLVINAVRPWKWHVPISVAAMNCGKHAATEVPAAETIEGCWQLVETAEKTHKYCPILENCCYFRNVMLVHHMLRQGLFGELRHCEAGYQHYIADPSHRRPRAGWPAPHRQQLSDARHRPGRPVDGHQPRQPLRLPRLHERRRHRGNRDADINTSLIRTVNGQTVTLYYDTKLPRPYDLIYRVQGTKGIYSATLDQIYIEGRSPKRDTWEPMDAYYKEFEHPLWKAWGGKALSQGGHGGADWMTLYRLIKALRTGTAPDIDVYDAATWSCITELSEKSVANRSSPHGLPRLHPRPLENDSAHRDHRGVGRPTRTATCRS